MFHVLMSFSKPIHLCNHYQSNQTTQFWNFPSPPKFHHTSQSCLWSVLALTSIPANHWCAFCLCSFVFSRNFIQNHHSLCSLLRQVSFTQHSVFEFIYDGVCFSSWFFFYWRVVFHCLSVPYFVYPVTSWWLFGSFHFGAMKSWCGHVSFPFGLYT